MPAGDLVSLLLRALGVGLSLQGDLVAALRRVAEAKRVLRSKGLYDPITLAIVELLALYGPLNVSELTRLMRRARGRASRRVVSERLRALESVGIVRRVRGRGRRYLLSTA